MKTNNHETQQPTTSKTERTDQHASCEIQETSRREVTQSRWEMFEGGSGI